MSIFASDIQGCLIGFIFLQLHISDQSADFRGDGVGQPKSFYMFGKGLGCYVFFGEDHQIQGGLKYEQSDNQDGCRPGFTSTKYSTERKVRLSFDQGQEERTQGGQYMLVWIAEQGMHCVPQGSFGRIVGLATSAAKGKPKEFHCCRKKQWSTAGSYSGTCGRAHWRPQPTRNLSIGMLMKTSSSQALRLSPIK